jgi:predicted ATP-grasp superfamily ATP-dependent carboligase
MNVFVYEHITSGALINESLPASLAHEGNQMLAAIVHDMALLKDIKLLILRDSRLEPLSEINICAGYQCIVIDNERAFKQHYTDSVKEADAVIIIAPETDELLQNLQQSVLNHNTLLLGCRPTATHICSDKIICYQQLLSNNVVTPHTISANEWSQNSFNSSTGFVVKPLAGAGCIDTLFFADSSAVTTYLTSSSLDLNKIIIQAYIEGNAISLSILCDDQASRVLAINQQHIQLKDGQLSFQGCTVNGTTEIQFNLNQATTIADKTHHAIPGLWGFIGIDLIVTDNESYVVDINPRITTSYVGLHQSLNVNPAQLLLTMVEYGFSALPLNFQRDAIEITI